MKFYILDVFAKEKYQGNQLATLIVDRPLKTKEMQQISGEINFSETSFICRVDHSNHEADVRIFTPKTEVDFAGHPVIGTSYVMQQLLNDNPHKITLNLKVGPVNVQFSGDPSAPYWVQQPKPTFGEKLNLKTVSALLDLPAEAFADDLPFQMVSTGLPHFILPVKKLDWLKKCHVNLDIYWDLVRVTGIKNILVYAEDPYEDSQDVSVRMFAPALGIAEDPATGSGNGCLAAYLMHYRHKDPDQYAFRIGQGYEIGRPSHLYLKVNRIGTEYDIHLGGNVVEIAVGNWGA